MLSYHDVQFNHEEPYAVCYGCLYNTQLGQAPSITSTLLKYLLILIYNFTIVVQKSTKYIRKLAD